MTAGRLGPHGNRGMSRPSTLMIPDGLALATVYGRLINARYIDNSHKWAGGGALVFGDVIYEIADLFIEAR